MEPSAALAIASARNMTTQSQASVRVIVPRERASEKPIPLTRARAVEVGNSPGGASRLVFATSEAPVHLALRATASGVRIDCRSERRGAWVILPDARAGGADRKELVELDDEALATSVEVPEGPGVGRHVRTRTRAWRIPSDAWRVFWLSASPALAPLRATGVEAELLSRGSIETRDIAVVVLPFATLWVDPPFPSRPTTRALSRSTGRSVGRISAGLQGAERIADVLAALSTPIASAELWRRADGDWFAERGDEGAAWWTCSDDGSVPTLARLGDVLASAPRGIDHPVLVRAVDGVAHAAVCVERDETLYAIVFPTDGMGTVIDDDVRDAVSRVSLVWIDGPRAAPGAWNEQPDAVGPPCFPLRDEGQWRQFVSALAEHSERLIDDAASPEVVLDAVEHAAGTLGPSFGIEMSGSVLVDLCLALPAWHAVREAVRGLVAETAMVWALESRGTPRTREAVAVLTRYAMQAGSFLPPHDERAPDRLAAHVGAIERVLRWYAPEKRRSVNLVGWITDKRATPAYTAVTQHADLVMLVAPSRVDLVAGGRCLALSDVVTVAIGTPARHEEWHGREPRRDARLREDLAKLVKLGVLAGVVQRARLAMGANALPWFERVRDSIARRYGASEGDTLSDALREAFR